MSAKLVIFILPTLFEKEALQRKVEKNIYLRIFCTVHKNNIRTIVCKPKYLYNLFI